MRPARLLAAGAAVALVLGACGDDGGDAAADASATPSSLPSSQEPAPVPTELDAAACLQVNTMRPLLATPGPLQAPPTSVPVPEQPAEELGVRDLLVGDGPEVVAGDCVVVNYVGVGQQSRAAFDSSFANAQEFVVPVGAGRVIDGWDQGLPGATLGSRRLLTIPGQLAYGDAPPPARGLPDEVTIAPGETLVFVVDLLAAVQPDGEVVTGSPTGEPGDAEPGPGEVPVDLTAPQG